MPKKGQNSNLVAIKPVQGMFLNNVPAVEQAVPAKVAKELVATGAFTEGGRVTNAAAETGAETAEVVASPEVSPLTEEAEGSAAGEAEASEEAGE